MRKCSHRDSGTLTAVRNSNEILRPIEDWPYTRPVVTWFRLVQQFLGDEGTDDVSWPARPTDLSSIKHLWDIKCHHVASALAMWYHMLSSN